MRINKGTVHRFYNSTKIYLASLSALCDRKHPRRHFRNREFRRAAKEWWEVQRRRLAKEVDPRFELAFADLFCAFCQFGVEFGTICSILELMGFEITGGKDPAQGDKTCKTT